MKKLFFALTIGLVAFTSCDKVENPNPQVISDLGSCGWAAYPNGDSAHYMANEWPTFGQNTNAERNILLEDFTGHDCTYCPAAAEEAHAIALAHPGRVIISTVHTSQFGIGSFQAVSASHPHDFTNPNGLAIGQYFGQDWPGSNFIGNPKGMVCRAVDPVQPILSPSQWSSAVDDLIATNDLKVNIQSAVNYYPSTRGVFLHTEVDVLDASLVNDLSIVVQLHEDSLISPQTFPSPISYDENYVHRDIMRGCIDGKTFGETLNNSYLDANGKYYVNYMYCLPEHYDENNVHFLIYVRDAVTEEVYQVIKQTL